MKYQQLYLGILIGILLSYAGMRVIHHIKRAGGIQAAVSSLGQPAQADTQDKPQNEMSFSTFKLGEEAKLGQVTFNYDFVPENSSHNAVMQMFLHVGGAWEKFTPTDANGTIVLKLFQGLDNAGAFVIDLPKGYYNEYRIILFDAPDGQNADFNHVLWDSSLEKKMPLPALNLTVTSSVAPVNSPTLAYPPNPLEQVQGNGLTTVTLPVLVKYPVDYNVENGGFWVMAKGDAGFSQVWADQKDATQSSDVQNPYYEISTNLTLKDLKAGVWNAQIGIFDQSERQPISPAAVQWLDSNAAGGIGQNLELTLFATVKPVDMLTGTRIRNAHSRKIHRLLRQFRLRTIQAALFAEERRIIDITKRTFLIQAAVGAHLQSVRPGSAT